MAEASLVGDVRDMGEAIRYWECVHNAGKSHKHGESRISAIYRAMRLAFPGEDRISKLSQQIREKS